MQKEAFLTQKGPKAVGPYSTAVCVDKMVYLSGIIPVNPASGKIEAADVEGQARQVLNNMDAILGEMGLSMGDVVKTTVFMTDLAAFARVNAIYAEYFREPFPARPWVLVSGLPAGAQIEIEAIAVRA